MKANDLLLRTLEPGTRKNYGAGLLRFNQFCDDNGVSEENRMPASDALLSAFVAEWEGKVSRSCIDGWLAGLAFWHSLNGASWRGDRRLRQALKGISKGQPPPNEKRPPVTLEHLYALRNGLDLTNSFDAAVYAVACIAFWCCRRYVLIHA